MKPGFYHFIFTACVILAIGCGWQNGVHQSDSGDTLAKSVVIYAATDSRMPGHETAKLAIESYGTNAIPHLLQWIGQVTPGNPGEVASASNPRTKALAVPAAFGLLGNRAVSAIPSLERLLTEGDPLVSAIAGLSLGRIGASGLPILTNALRHDRPEVRRNACEAMVFQGTNAVAALPIIKLLANDSDLETRNAASMLLSVLDVPQTK